MEGIGGNKKTVISDQGSGVRNEARCWADLVDGAKGTDRSIAGEVRGRAQTSYSAMEESVPFAQWRQREALGGEEKAFFAKRIVHAMAGTRRDERGGTRIEEV
jgi:hypothetical protein